jgi:Flp pilus assembly protein TadG
MFEFSECRARMRTVAKGQATIELAVFLPLFLLVLLGMVEMGNAWDTANRASQGAHEAAEYARRMRGSDLAGAENLARKFVGDTANVSISLAGSSSAGNGSLVTVTVQIDEPLVTGNFLKLFQVFRTGSIRIERRSTALYIRT